MMSGLQPCWTSGARRGALYLYQHLPGPLQAGCDVLSGVHSVFITLQLCLLVSRAASTQQGFALGCSIVCSPLQHLQQACMLKLVQYPTLTLWMISTERAAQGMLT